MVVLYQLSCCLPPSRHVAALKQKGIGDPRIMISTLLLAKGDTTPEAAPRWVNYQ